MYFVTLKKGDHELYHHALKHYDLDLALEAAQALDMDPKEYLANLNELDQEENDLRRKFKIDRQLEHFFNALVKLIELFKLGQG